jgi:hypothetical protein
MRKGNVSYQVELLECEHKRASEGQHVRKALFNESLTACQGQKLGQRTKIGPLSPQNPDTLASTARPHRVGQWPTGEKRLEVGHHAILHGGV